MTSTKYRKHYRSKYVFPTRIVKSSQYDGTLVLGHKNARDHIERHLGRKLHEDTKVRTAGMNLVFLEPRR